MLAEKIQENALNLVRLTFNHFVLVAACRVEGLRKTGDTLRGVNREANLEGVARGADKKVEVGWLMHRLTCVKRRKSWNGPRRPSGQAHV